MPTFRSRYCDVSSARTAAPIVTTSLGPAPVSLDSPSDKDSGYGLMLELGAHCALTRQWALRTDWERYCVSAFGTRPTIDPFSFGAQMSH